MRLLPALLVALALLGGAPTTGAAQSTDTPVGVRPSPEHPRYWQYVGEATLLVGGSREDNLFQIDSLEAHLDRLAAVGGNYVRNTMSSRDAGDAWPFHRRA